MAKVTWEMSGEEAVGSSRTAFIKKIYELAEKDQSRHNSDYSTSRQLSIINTELAYQVF